MMKGKRKPPGGDELRRRAEERLRRRKRTAAEPLSEDESRRLLDELAVHQIEVEVQNEELRSARIETERGLERYTELFDFAPIGCLTITPEETIREVNHAGARLLGLDRSGLLGARFGNFIAVGARSAFRELVGRALASRAKESCETELARIAAAALPVRITAAALERTEPIMLLAIEDISERLAREKELSRIEHELREADRRKDEFMAVLSHELRNPLAPIQNGLFVLSRATPGGDEAQRAQEIIGRQVSHLVRLVDDLFDVARITRGRIQLRREIVDLAELVVETVEDHRPSFDAAGIGIERRLEAGLYLVDADPARLIQALSNVLGNAMKFTSRGGSVSVDLGRVDGHAVLTVCDTGVGIAPELLAQVFTPLAQAPQSIDRPKGGLGLGLTVVKGLMELHGGSVSITSAGLGRGTQLTIKLPLERVDTRPAPAVEPAAAGSRRVLVIEDNPDAADSLRDSLMLSGHEVQVAYDGPRGLALARSFAPDAVICDLGLPGMDGYEVARAMRADERLGSVLLVAVSGYSQPQDLQRAADAGFDRHVAKPASLKTLEKLLTDLPLSARGGVAAGAASATHALP